MRPATRWRSAVQYAVRPERSLSKLILYRVVLDIFAGSGARSRRLAAEVQAVFINQDCEAPAVLRKPSRCSVRVDADATCPPHEFGLLVRAYRSRHAASALSAGGVEPATREGNWPVPGFTASRPAGAMVPSGSCVSEVSTAEGLLRPLARPEGCRLQNGAYRSDRCDLGGARRRHARAKSNTRKTASYR